MSFGGQSQQRWGDNTVHSGEFLRDLQLTDLAGRVCHTGPARVKGALILAFFAPTDAGSVALLKSLQALEGGYKEGGKLTIFALSQNDEAETRAVGTEAGATFPLLLDRGGYHAGLYGLATFPTLYLARADGSVAVRVKGGALAGLQSVSDAVAKIAGVEPVDLSAT